MRSLDPRPVKQVDPRLAGLIAGFNVTRIGTTRNGTLVLYVLKLDETRARELAQTVQRAWEAHRVDVVRDDAELDLIWSSGFPIWPE